MKKNSIGQSKTLKFSVSGLRGVYGLDITPENIPLFCAAFHRTLPQGGIAIARDTRNTGNAMKQIVLSSLTSLGREVIDLGIVPTPTIKNYVALKKQVGGIMLSASHNPPEYNAFKFIKKNGLFFDEKNNQKFLEELNRKTNWNSYQKQGSLRNAQEEAVQQHIEETLHQIQLPKKTKLRVAVDSLGACGTHIAVAFLKKIGAEVFSLYPNFLEKFPRKPEPTEKALRLLSSFVVENNCDVGFAFDPDADRLGLVSSSGKIPGEEYTLPLAGLEGLRHRDGGMVVNLSSSWLNQWAAEQYDRKLFRSKTGESHVIQLMKKKKSNFGGEGNGGVIDMKISSQGRDVLSGMAWVIALMHQRNQTLDEILSKMPSTVMKKISIPIQNSNALSKMRRELTKGLPELTLNQEDGLHFSARDGLPWLHIRASNTEPIIRIMAEAHEPKTIRRLLSYINVS